MSEDKYLYAFDLSLDCSGLTIFNLTTMEHVLTTSFPMVKSVSKGEKLRSLEVELIKLMKKYPANLVAAEGVFISTVSKNQYAQANRYKAAEALFNVHGLIYTRFWNVPLKIYSPTKIKKTVGGHGQSTKEKLQKKIKERFPNMSFRNTDESDSFSVCVTCLVDLYNYKW